jgi:hypothetical protein
VELELDARELVLGDRDVGEWIKRRLDHHLAAIGVVARQRPGVGVVGVAIEQPGVIDAGRGLQGHHGGIAIEPERAVESAARYRGQDQGAPIREAIGDAVRAGRHDRDLNLADFEGRGWIHARPGGHGHTADGHRD